MIQFLKPKTLIKIYSRSYDWVIFICKHVCDYAIYRNWICFWFANFSDMGKISSDNYRSLENSSRSSSGYMSQCGCLGACNCDSHDAVKHDHHSEIIDEPGTKSTTVGKRSNSLDFSRRSDDYQPTENTPLIPKAEVDSPTCCPLCRCRCCHCCMIFWARLVPNIDYRFIIFLSCYR